MTSCWITCCSFNDLDQLIVRREGAKVWVIFGFIEGGRNVDNPSMRSGDDEARGGAEAFGGGTELIQGRLRSGGVLIRSGAALLQSQQPRIRVLADAGVLVRRLAELLRRR